MDDLYRILSVKHPPCILSSVVGMIYWAFLSLIFVFALDVGEAVFEQVSGQEECCRRHLTMMEFY